MTYFNLIKKIIPMTLTALVAGMLAVVIPVSSASATAGTTHPDVDAANAAANFVLARN